MGHIVVCAVAAQRLDTGIAASTVAGVTDMYVGAIATVIKHTLRTNFKDQLNSQTGVIYHILSESQYGIWTIRPFRGHLVLKVPAIIESSDMNTERGTECYSGSKAWWAPPATTGEAAQASNA